MLAVMVSAMLCKFEGYEAVALWIRVLPTEFWHVFGGTRKPPCANAYRKLMDKVCPQEMERALNAWITEGLGLNLEDHVTGIIVEGKVLRGTRSEHARAMQIPSGLESPCPKGLAPIGYLVVPEKALSRLSCLLLV
jgi:hypothetical protein